MNVYNFKKIEKCYVFGNIDRNMDRFIKTITSNISKFKKEANSLKNLLVDKDKDIEKIN
jgi:hypothetical protein